MPKTYHIWFGTKKRKWLLLGEVEDRAKSLLWQIAEEKGIDLIECETMVNHVHLLLRAEPSYLPEAVRLLKGISSYRLFKDFPELKMHSKIESFWQIRYGAKMIAEEAVFSVIGYVRTQKERLDKFDRQYRISQT